MRRWFLSYTSQDFALTQALKTALKRKDLDAEIFFAPDSMRAGGFWKKQLADEIKESTAFVLLVGENGLGHWQVMEYYEALDRRPKEPNYPIILIVSPKQPAPGLPFAGQLHWVLTEEPASEATVGKLMDAASGSEQRPGELWRFTRPYRGLEAMAEANSDYFFGRDRKTIEVIDALASTPGTVPILLGNSGVGKSSLAQAGVMASLLRQGWSDKITDAGSWPEAFCESRRWCFLTLRPGTQPLQALVALFFDTWQYKAASSERVKEEKGWIDLLHEGKAALPDLLDATERRYKELAQTAPPAFLLYIDQGEELYVRASERERRRFSEIFAHGLGDHRLRALMSMRSDFLGDLQSDESLFAIHRKIDVPPLRESELNGVIREPARQLAVRFETEELVSIITRRTLEDSATDVGALPLLSYTLDDMWTEMVRRGDGVMRLPAGAFELGGVLAKRANAFLARNPSSEGALRRVLTIRLATVRKEGDPTRRRARRSEFSDDEWRLVIELADYPNRLLVTATPEGGETYAEVAHEAIFSRWDKLREWINAEREFLAWKTTLDDDRRRWESAPDDSKNDALLLGLALVQAQNWLVQRGEDLSKTEREFIDLSQQVERDRREASRQLEIRLTRLQAEKEAQEERERASAEEVLRLRAEQDARKERERADAIVERNRRRRRRRLVILLAILLFLIPVIPLGVNWYNNWYSTVYIPSVAAKRLGEAKSSYTNPDVRKQNMVWLAEHGQSFDFSHAVLHHFDLKNLYIAQANFRQAILDDVDFTGATLRSAHFDDAHLEKIKLSQANLGGAVFDQADLCNVDFSGADLTDASFLNISYDEPPNFKDTAWWLSTGWNLQHVDLYRKQQGELDPIVADNRKTLSQRNRTYSQVMKGFDAKLKSSSKGSLDRAIALDGMSWYRAIWGLELADAEKTAQEAVNIFQALKPEPDVLTMSYVVDTLAYILLQMDRPQDARKWWEIAIRATENPGATFRYALALHILGDVSEAEQNLNLAIRRGYWPSSELLLLRRYFSGSDAFVTTLANLTKRQQIVPGSVCWLNQN